MSKVIENKEKGLINPLITKKVKVSIIKKNQSSLHKNIDDSTLSIGGAKSFACPINLQTNKLVNPLTREERAYLEDITGEDLNHLNKRDNFYQTKDAMCILRKTGRKTESADLTLDLSDPYQFILYKIALINPRVANTWAERNDRKEYEFVIVDGDVELKEELSYTKIYTDVQKYLIKNEGSKKKLFDLFRMYGAGSSKHINYNNTNAEFIFNELQKLARNKKNVQGLHALIKLGEKDISDKIFVQDCVTLGLVSLRGKEYHLNGGHRIGRNELEVIDWFNALDNNEVKRRFETEIADYYER
ncbi:MAG: hypothetical protein GY775_19360 [Candidatus Scalindua sp.]|nr:hypothetical protein [Candidatus Scalindua sp.]